MPMRLDEGWNQIQFNLSDFTRRAYGTNYVETLRVQIHANVRIRRIYFSDKLYTEDELPAEFKLFVPVPQQAQKDVKDAAAVEKSVEKSVEMEKEKEKITKTIISVKTDEVGKKSETDASADEKENVGVQVT
jgi:hypothetical protein